jgi:hypothetical protein
VTVPEAVILVAPAILPALVIPPELLFKPPVIEAPPEETVRVPAEEIVPVPVVEILPEEEREPSSLMVSLLTPPDWIARAVLVAALVSLMTKEVAVPALVREKEVGVPESDD